MNTLEATCWPENCLQAHAIDKVSSGVGFENSFSDLQLDPSPPSRIFVLFFQFFCIFKFFLCHQETSAVMGFLLDPFPSHQESLFSSFNFFFIFKFSFAIKRLVPLWGFF